MNFAYLNRLSSQQWIVQRGGSRYGTGTYVRELRKTKDKKVVMHCRSGGRSGQVVDYLEKKFGFDNLYNLKGGILAWADEIDPSVTKY